jgi:hypothetical protein
MLTVMPGGLAMTRLRPNGSIRIAAVAVACLVGAMTQPWRILAQSPKFATIQEADLKQFLSYLSADQLLGRQTFTEGYGLAAGYIAANLQQWGVKPLGENGTYFQTVKLNDVKVVSDNSTVTVEVNGQSRTFKNGEGVRFSTPAGGPQTLVFDGVEFLGYAMYLADRNDYQGKTVKGKAVVWINGLPANLATGLNRVMTGRARHAIAEAFAAASISYTMPGQGGGRGAGAAAAQAAPQRGAVPATPETGQTTAARSGEGGQPPRAGGQGAGFGGRGQRMIANTVLSTAAQGDFTTPDNFNRLNPPQITGDDAFFEFLFSGAPKSFAELKDLAARQQALPTFSLPNVKMTFKVDATYQVLQTLYTHNVVGLVEGSDARLKDTYVLFGAHLDHVGYLAAPRGGGAGARGGAAAAPAAPPADPAAQPPTGAGPGANAGAGRGGGRCPNNQPGDLISNGADDDGSGSASELAIAKAFATGSRPKRSLVFIWHAGEEMGLYGSRYNADFPVVPIDRIAAQLNMDMVGRDNYDNRDADYSNSVFIVGADRISTDLHNVVVDTNTTLKKPLKLDYEMNDPTDPEAVYYRSDHYSYASKGIPIAFFTTGLHNDYHCVSDTWDKINFEKMARIDQLVYQTGYAIANMDKPLDRDNLGPRSGKAFQGKIKKN